MSSGFPGLPGGHVTSWLECVLDMIMIQALFVVSITESRHAVIVNLVAKGRRIIHKVVPVL